MDFVDILITLGIFAFFIVSEVLKIKKKQAVAAQKTTARREDVDEDYESSEMDFFMARAKRENEKFTPKSSKSTTYFTYEDVSVTDEMHPSPTEIKPSSSKENYIQVSENETEIPNIDLQNPEELKKAIIYSEILKNPYN